MRPANRFFFTGILGLSFWGGLNTQMLRAQESDTPALIIANFPESRSEAYEGDRVAYITVQFSEAFTGDLHYRIEELTPYSPESNIDAQPPLDLTVPVSGVEVKIPIELIDDGLSINQIFDLSLLTNQDSVDYEIGSRINHRLFIKENDAVWRGNFSQPFGTVLGGGFGVSFRFKMTRKDRNTTGEFISGFSDQQELWPAVVKWDNDSFRASVDSIPLGTWPVNNPAGSEFYRSLLFEADSKQTGQSVSPDTIQGSVTETISSINKPYLNRTQTMSFVLIKEIDVENSSLEVPVSDNDQ